MRDPKHVGVRCVLTGTCQATAFEQARAVTAVAVTLHYKNGKHIEYLIVYMLPCGVVSKDGC